MIYNENSRPVQSFGCEDLNCSWAAKTKGQDGNSTFTLDRMREMATFIESGAYCTL